MTREVIVAVDTGGTFTDIVAWIHGALVLVKTPSTPDDPARALLEGTSRALAGLDVESRAFDLLIHGSTVATNALLERRGARVVLVTNRGFEDVLAIGRQNRPHLYALTGSREEPLVPQERRIGVAGRLGPRGEEIEPLDAAELAGLGDRLRALQPESIAICLLHSYANDAHEATLASALAGLGLPCSVSSVVLPEYREYERTATTVVNAYVAPLMDKYLGRIEADSGARRVRIMGSGGGALPVDRARRDAAHTILSGPAGGVAGALHVAARHGIASLMTFDMGGTSTDVSLCPGSPLHTREFSIAGTPVALPVLDIHTVGAGGGSIARLDAAGGLRVGPASAGAVPGPICYGRGGSDLTVTDANVALGRLIPHTAALRLDPAAVKAPLAAFARDMRCSPDEAADGIIAVVNAAMEGALRVISVERGYDPADFTLVPFGGAAGLHAVALAARLDIPRLLIPPAPGVLSAYGMLVAPVRRDAARSVLLSDVDAATLGPVFAELAAAAAEPLLEEGAEPHEILLRRLIDARYRGQSHELTVAAEDWPLGFHDAHERRFGYASPDTSVEAVTLRVQATAPPPAVPAPVLPRAAGAAVPEGMAAVWLDGSRVRAPVFMRERLLAGHVLHGAALLQEQTAALWLPPDWTARVLGDGSLLVEH
jgi:N-methylhydantoinase A